MRTGVFGGTFDPPHIGHLIVAQDALRSLGLDRVLFVPAAVAPHKQDRTSSGADVRRAMLTAAVGDDVRFDVSSLELDRRPPSYTVDTLRTLRGAAPEDELYLLIGADQWRIFDDWREGEAIRRLATVVVLSRQGEAVDPAAPEDVRFLTVTRVDLSSTEIRRRVREGEPIHYWVPDAVRDIIEREGLYRD